MRRKHNIYDMLAITAVIASFVISCSGRIRETDESLASKPLQRVIDMFTIQTDNGKVDMRIEARLMEHYENDTLNTDLFPYGISVFSYNDEGLLEAIVLADEARHTTKKDGDKNEVWSAYGNVVIHNVLKMETMETDTIYWDQTKEEIYTDCYVKMYSPEGFMQGNGMRTDDHARNSVLFNPYNGYATVVKDSTAVVIDSVNFIGPFPKKITKFAAPIE